MGAIKTGWDFFQDQILGMHWLKDLIGNLLVKAGMGESRFPGEFLHFFIYDVIKIFVLLAVLIFLISWNGDTVLLLFFNPNFYGIYKCRTATWSDIFISHIFSDGRSWFACVAHECVWRQDCVCICNCRTDCGGRWRHFD